MLNCETVPLPICTIVPPVSPDVGTPAESQLAESDHFLIPDAVLAPVHTCTAAIDCPATSENRSPKAKQMDMRGKYMVFIVW